MRFYRQLKLYFVQNEVLILNTYKLRLVILSAWPYVTFIPYFLKKGNNLHF